MMPRAGDKTWTCVICRKVHPIHHAGGASPAGMACQGKCMAILHGKVKR